ncbi:YceI family protein [Sphingomonas morindae]|uniref:YceI family protein n=1 Tax=Sphingomonas morindae TaxID=1541170 RepID=A0ABY4X5G2_9SPHN|nr:YceI family protein [Sphingomonas morindae]USI72075.1 YceI family protein [Sphingomonas morindae]
MRPLPLFAALLIAGAATAQAPIPGSPDTKAVTAGTYKVEPGHTQIVFAVDHMGFSIFRGVFSGASGSLTLDPADIAKTALSVTVPTASVKTTSAKLDEELVSSDWLDAQRYPQASFVSTKINPGPNNTARVEGTLTLHGVTKPATMMVHFHGAGTNPMSKAQTIGFDGRLGFNRSDFGVAKYVPVVSDHVELTIAGAFEKAG